jgi:hypothetical protein
MSSAQSSVNFNLTWKPNEKNNENVFILFATIETQVEESLYLLQRMPIEHYS